MSPHHTRPCFILTPGPREALGSMWIKVARVGFQAGRACKLSLKELTQSKEGQCQLYPSCLGRKLGTRGHSLDVLTKVMLKPNLHCDC